jgi:16S rRNA (guanine527-N7)-methyltransferase
MPPQSTKGHKHQHDFVLVRAVATIDKLYGFAKPLIKEEQHNPIPNGILALKGGDLEEELATLQDTYVDQVPLSKFYEADLFPDKYLVYVQA